MIELKMYTTDEFKELLGITRNIWERRRDELMVYIKDYFDYEIVRQGSVVYYNITKQYQEWEPMPRNYKGRDIEKMEYYDDQVDRYVEFHPITTGTTIGRYVVKNHNKYNHSIEIASRRCRDSLNRNYTECDGAWCIYKDENRTVVTPLEDEELEEWKKILKDTFNDSDAENEAKVVSGIENGEIDEDEGNRMIVNIAKSKYRLAMRLFSVQYASCPFYAPKWEKSAID